MPALRYHPKNRQFMCRIHHNQWEREDRTTMKVYESNQQLKEELMLEHYGKTDKD